MKNLIESEKSAEKVIDFLTEERIEVDYNQKANVLIIRKGMSFTVVLHQDGIKKLIDVLNNRREHRYTDEQGKTWDIYHENEHVIFSGVRTSQEVKIHDERFKMLF